METTSPRRLCRAGRLAAFGSAVALIGLLAACAPASTPTGGGASSPPPTSAGASQSAPAPQSSGQTYTMKFGFATLNDVQHEFANRLKERVEAQSNGRLKIEVYPASQLGNNQRMIEGVQLGTQEATIQPPEFVFGLDPRYVVLSLPYLFDTADEANKVLATPVADQIIDAGEGKGLKGLSVIQYGFAGILGHYQIRTPDDLRGKKIRVLGSQIELDTLSSWGATGVPMALSEVGPGLQQKTVDGVIQAPQTYLAFKYHEIAPYYTATQHYIITSIFLVNKGWFDRLPPDLQKLLTDQSKGLQNEMSAFSDQKNAETLKITRETPGDEVIELTTDQRNLFKATAQSVWDKYLQATPNARPLLEGIQAESRKVRGQ
jgi:tripartite ATP-independent transporter DctP family solute receptor